MNYFDLTFYNFNNVLTNLQNSRTNLIDFYNFIDQCTYYVLLHSSQMLLYCCPSWFFSNASLLLLAASASMVFEGVAKLGRSENFIKEVYGLVYCAGGKTSIQYRRTITNAKVPNFLIKNNQSNFFKINYLIVKYYYIF